VTRAHVAVRIGELELSEGIRPLEGLDGYRSAALLVRWQGQPIGWVRIPGDVAEAGRISAERVREAVTDQLGRDLAGRLLGIPVSVASPREQAPAPAISVVVCTRDRPDQLRGCLAALLAQDHPSYDVLVVDNASTSSATARVAAAAGVRCVREERPGLDWARNRGIAEAHHDIIAFTDDDARPDRAWLRAIAAAFTATTDVMAVTGLVAPAELETAAQARFELEYGGMGHGLQRRLIHRSALSTVGLLWASGFGVGANMAFRREVFRRVGPFDPALDLGTPAAGCGDVELLHRVVAAGGTLVYEPRALVWHQHRPAAADLDALVWHNGTGFGAYLLTCVRNRTVNRLAILHFFIRQWLGWWLLRRLLRPAGFPRHLVGRELLGALVSPFAYRAAQARARQIAKAGAPQRGGR